MVSGVTLESSFSMLASSSSKFALKPSLNSAFSSFCKLLRSLFRSYSFKISEMFIKGFCSGNLDCSRSSEVTASSKSVASFLLKNASSLAAASIFLVRSFLRRAKFS